MPVRTSQVRSRKFEIYCKECEHTFANKKNFDGHLEKDTCKHTCELCGKIFLYGMKKQYLNHRKYHNKQKDYKCDICGKSYVRMGELNRHIQWHKESIMAVCDQCGQTFRCTSGLSNHKKIKHCGNSEKKTDEKIKKYQCPECPKTYLAQYRLRWHIKSTHVENDTRRYSCSICQQKFHIKHRMKNHEFFHTAAKVHKCDQCDAAFKTPNQLRAHIKRHNGDYRYFCQFCGRGFYGLREVREHENIHTGQKPYKCELCDYRCACKTNIGIHMKHVHRKKWFKSNIALAN